MKQFFSKQFSKWEMGFYGFFLLFCGGIALVSAQTQDTSPDQVIQKTKSTPKEKKQETISPQISSAFSSQKFIGRIRSNTTTMVHARREGIIKDILVDVGDSVSPGQVLAYLFPPGVEGQSSARIQKTLAELTSAQEELQKAQSVAKQSQAVSKQNLSQAETKFSNLVSTTDIRSKREQHLDRIHTESFQIGENIRWILFGDNKSSLSSNAIIGHFNDSIQENKVFTVFQKYQQSQESLSNQLKSANSQKIFKHLEQLENLLHQTEKLYKNAVVSPNHSQESITKHLASIQQYQNTILNLKNTFDSLLLSAKDTQEEIEQKKSMLLLTQSQNERAIELAQKKVEIAQAAYQSELSTSGHNTIIAPFSGVITNRLVDVGQAIGTNKTLFQLRGTQTSLSNHGTEVVFEIPQSRQNQIEKDHPVTVFFPYTNKEKNALIQRIEKNIDAQSGTFSVFARFSEPLPDQTDGERVFVALKNTHQSIWSLPSSTLKRKGLQHYIWIQKEQNLYHIPVTVLAEDGEWSDVRGPLTADMDVIHSASASLWRDSKPFPHLSES